MSDEGGISPVIGIILIVAIVVILASVVGAFALGFGDETTDPQPTLGTDVTYDQSTDGDGQSLIVDIISGDQVKVSRLSVTVTGAEIVEPDGSTTEAVYQGTALSSVGTELKPGKSLTLDKTDFEKAGGGTPASDEYLDLSDANVNINWREKPSSGSSSIIFRWQPENS